MMESLGVDGLLSDVQRMDKRQVSGQICGIQIQEETYLMLRSGSGSTVFLPGFELRNDRFLSADDLEGSDGGHRKRIAHCGGPQWQYGTGFPSVSIDVCWQCIRI